jgi:hypothetical protein
LIGGETHDPRGRRSPQPVSDGCAHPTQHLGDFASTRAVADAVSAAPSGTRASSDGFQYSTVYAQPRCITEIKLRAERRAGELLIELAARKERHSGRGHTKTVGSRVVTPRPEPKLDDLGVTKKQSSRWQKLAEMPASKFEAKVAKSTKLAVAAISDDKAVVREARAEVQAGKKERRAEREAAAEKQLVLPDKKFGVVLADPEWRFAPQAGRLALSAYARLSPAKNRCFMKNAQATRPSRPGRRCRRRMGAFVVAHRTPSG